MNTNTSATGGPLAPITPLPNNDVTLEDLLQPWIVGITGLDANGVRPLWQEDPPPRPDRIVDWMYFGVKTHKRPTFASVTHTESGDQLYRMEELELTCMTYGPNADATSDMLANGLQIPQNREYLFLNSMSFVSVSDPVTVPEKVKTRYIRRVDLRIYLRRAVCLTYPVLDIVGADLTLKAGDQVREIDLAPPTPSDGGFGVGPFGEFGFGE